MKASLDFEGMDTITAFIHNVSPRVTQYLYDELVEVGDEAFAESQMQVPVRTGALKGSGHITDPIMEPGNIALQIGYGGPAAGYALFVHENLAAHHSPPTKAKYLEDPVNAAIQSLPSRMAGRLEAAMLGQYPGSPAKAQQAEGAADIASHAPGRKGRRATSMSPDEIESALHDLAEGKLRVGIRAGGRHW